jgi:Ca2+/Na+ antiporter
MAWPPLIFLFAAYGYILFRASGFISDGAELLMLVMSPGLIGGLVLPVMGAVPDGAIMLFSGIGPDAQEQLSVGVGTLAGSTIMLLTLPWAACAVVGRVDLNEQGSAALYKRGLTQAGRASWGAFFTRTGIQTSSVVRPGALIMLVTSASYLVMQGPAWAQRQFPAMEDATPAQAAAVAAAVDKYALAGFVLALLFFIAYSFYSVRSSMQEEAQAAVIREGRRRAVAQGLVGLAQLISLERSVAREEEEAQAAAGGVGHHPHAQCDTNPALIKALFDKYDADDSGALDVGEVRAMLAELKLPLPASYVKELVREVGGDDHVVQLDEFKKLLDTCMEKVQAGGVRGSGSSAPRAAGGLQAAGAGAESSSLLEKGGEEEEEEEEEEEGEEEAANLTPPQIRRKAFGTLALGVAMVTLFSDPMVNVLSEVAVKTGIPAFYVAFIIAPIISNASEIISSISQAQKKRKANIDVTYSQLLGAATMNVRGRPPLPPHTHAPVQCFLTHAHTHNCAHSSPLPPLQNTFCLSIFLLIVYLKGLYWEFSSEVLAILIVELIMAVLVLTQKNNTMPVWKGLLAGLLFPGAILFVYLLQNKASMN